MSEEERLDAVEAARVCEEGLDWIQPGKNGINYDSGESLIRGERAKLARLYPNAKIFNVLGSDTALRYNNQPREPTVMIPRPDYDLEQMTLEVAHCKTELYIGANDKQCDASSTKLRTALKDKRWEDVKLMCTLELAHHLWANSHAGELDSDGMCTDDDGRAFATTYEMNCEYCDICESRVRRLAFECRQCDYGECSGCARTEPTTHVCDEQNLDESDEEAMKHGSKHIS